MKFLKLLILVIFFMLIPQQVQAIETPNCDLGYKLNFLTNACGKVKVPENGRLNRFGDDFECNRGYQRNEKFQTCNEIKLPENGVLTVAGNDWKCISNYERDGNSCVKVLLPKNAKFFIQGPDWFCNSNYQKQDGKCQIFDIPANAHLSYTGNDWICNSGFVKNPDKKSCGPVFVPANGLANYLGSFNCASGYRKIGDKCEKQPDIENGRFYELGADFFCSKGYNKNEAERKCEKIKIPENAHQDSLSLEGWTCNSEYIKEGNECKRFTLPEHGFWFNNNWGCELGFRKNPTNISCDKISLPENARYTNTYDGWVCNSGYTKNYRENRCDTN